MSPGPQTPPQGSRSAAPISPRPRQPRASAGSAYGLQRLLAPNPLWRLVARLLRSHRQGYRLFTALERWTKERLFGCHMCGQCVLPVTGYACPRTCPKQLSNGPCGGAGIDGACEVYPEVRCVWVVAYERATAAGHGLDLARFVGPIDHRLWGESAWVRYWEGGDTGLWTEPVLHDAPTEAPVAR